MRFSTFAVVVALSMPVVSWAQNRDLVPSWSISPRTGSPADGWPRDPLPQWSIPPLHEHPTRGDLPQVGLQAPERQRHDRPRRHDSGAYASWPVMFVMVPQVGAPAPPPAPALSLVEERVAKGSLVLQVEPAATQVFVDGYYVGAAEDFSGQRGGAFVDTGAHRIELIATGFEPVAFDVKISANQSITYRHEMKPTQTAPAPPASQLTKIPTTFYLIPGCYMGNVPPRDAGLPPTCDLSRTQTFRN